MARMRRDKFRLGPTNLTGGGGAQTVGTVPLATLVSGMVNGEQMYVRALVSLFDNVGAAASGAAYAQLLEVFVPIYLTAGPTYTIGTPSNASKNLVGTGPLQTVITFDTNSGNLRLRVTPAGDNIVAYAAIGTEAP
jgi:hypothetical protein